jgi:hypothetical protein
MRRLTVIRHLGLAIALFFLIDRAIFGSGIYFRWIAPDSSLGTMAQSIGNVRHIPPGARSILVIGDSRITEGFSSAIATEEAQRLGSTLTFTGGGVAGTVPRVWYYLIRQIDQPAQHLAAIAIMLPSYHDNDEEQQAARVADIAFVHPLLSLADLGVFPQSFPAPASRWEAVKAIIFKGYFYKNDVRDFIGDPMSRINTVNAWRRNGYIWNALYPGRPTSLAGLAFNMATSELTPALGHGAPQPVLLADYAAHLRVSQGRPPDNPDAAAYRQALFGRIADLCQRIGVPLFVFRIPRGPLHYLVAADTQPTGEVATLDHRGQIRLLPADSFDSLEKPQYFFDPMHMNRDGRGIFSTDLARLILAGMPAAKAAK